MTVGTIDNESPPGAWAQSLAQMPTGVRIAQRIELPWPASKLSNTRGHWSKHDDIIANHRTWASLATIAAKVTVPDEGDIRVSVEYYPPSYRMDRMNYWQMCKPYFDGIADALGINDKRFTPGDQHCFNKIKYGKIVIVI